MNNYAGIDWGLPTPPRPDEEWQLIYCSHCGCHYGFRVSVTGLSEEEAKVWRPPCPNPSHELRWLEDSDTIKSIKKSNENTKFVRKI